MLNVPWSELVTVRVSPVASFLMVTVAPATHPPLLSRTVPLNLAWSVCADAPAAHTSAIAIATRIVLKCIIAPPEFPATVGGRFDGDVTELLTAGKRSATRRSGIPDR